MKNEIKFYIDCLNRER